jgi:pimeloyl-ACP methyl ester carboxylesterase/DNA-binding SARP family transcriptional activator
VGVKFSLLGPFRVHVDGVDVTPSSLKSQALLATLTLRCGQAVAADTLVDGLWPDLSLDRGRRVLQVRMAEIRKQFKGVRDREVLIASVSGGYRLDVSPEALDSSRFLRLVRTAEAYAGRQDVARASTLLREALGLWQGDALAGLCVSRFLETTASELDELRLVAVEQRIAFELAEGCHGRLVAELESLVVEHPLRERLWELLVLALYRAGRQAEALRAAASIRRLLAEEVGVSPGTGLRAVEAAVLAQDPVLDLPAPPSAPQLWCEAAVSGVDPSVVMPDDPRRRTHAPPVQYARSSEGVNIAYQVVGDGPDLLFVPGYPSHLDVWWEPWGGQLTERLSEFVRLIIFDHRGMGLSDRPPDLGIDQWLEDIELVRMAAGADRPILLGVSAGGSVTTRYAAQNTANMSGLILYGTRARYLRSEDYPFGRDEDEFDSLLEQLEKTWGEGRYFDTACPSASGNRFLHGEYERYERLAASPSAAVSYLRALARMDVRDALPQVTVPSLVVHAKGDRSDPIEQARYMAERLPETSFVELESDDHLIWLSDARDQLIDAIRTFVLTRASPSGRAHSRTPGQRQRTCSPA